MTIVVALAALAPCSAHPRTWVLNPLGTGDAPSIQAAIDSTLDGDTILLRQGTYLEIFDFKGKDITISGSGRLNTTIDASTSDGPCATFISRETNVAVLEHMTLTGGKGHGTDTRTGGGVYIEGAEPVLRDLLIVRNGGSDGNAVSFGGGVQVFGNRIMVRPIIEDCEIRMNTAAINGGGLGFMGVVAPIIRRCAIYDNEAHFGDGGGVWCITTTGATINNNTITNNKAGDHGGGIYVATSFDLYVPLVEVANNLVAYNVAFGTTSDFTGGGMMYYGLNATIHHNTIVGNSAIHGGAGMVTGGIAMKLGGTYKLQYNIVANGVQGLAYGCETGVTVEFDHNVLWNNPPGTACYGATGGVGNVTADPLFCDPPENNFSVQEMSPALISFPSYAGYNPVPGCRGRYVWTTWSGIKTRYNY